MIFQESCIGKPIKMKRLLLLCVVVSLAAIALAADEKASEKDSKAQDRLQAAADVSQGRVSVYRGNQ